MKYHSGLSMLFPCSLLTLSTLHFIIPTSLCGKTKTTPSPGTWSEWGEWDPQCSTTCGLGFRRRSRQCSYIGPNRKLMCQGNAGQLKNCDTRLTCPVHGGWSSWVTWGRCSASCGGGRGLRRRSCTRPKPMFGGEKCDGPEEEMGDCNAGVCADQVYTLSPEASRKLDKSLEEFHNFQPDEGSPVTLPCDPDSLSALLSLYPASSVIFWTLNGRTLTVDVRRSRVSPTELSLLAAKPPDSGVYACRVRYGQGNRTTDQAEKVVSVSAVAVRPASPTATPAEGGDMALSCPGGGLLEEVRGSEELRQSWWLGRAVFKEFENGTVDEFLVRNVTRNMTGIWTCQINDLKRGWTWTTNKVKVRVLPEPPLHQTLLQDPVFWLVVGSVLFLLLVSVGTLFSYRFSKAREVYGEDFNKWLRVLEEMGSEGTEEECSENDELL